MANLTFSNPAWNPSAPSSSQPTLSFDKFDSSFSIWDSMTMGAAGLDMGRTVSASSANPAAAAGVNTTQVDGGANFVDALSGFGKALLEGIGVQDDRTPAAQVQPVGLFSREPKKKKGIGVEQIALFGLIGVGLYFAFASGSSGSGKG